MIEFFENSRPVVIAHRGYSGLATENTKKAIEAAMACGAHAVELDVRCTSDGELVIFHDEDTTRLAGVKWKVEEETYERLIELELPGGQRILSLQDALELVGGRIPINLELKGGGTGEKVLRLLAGTNYQGKVILSSFLAGEITRVRELSPRINLSLLASRPGKKDLTLARELRCVSLNVSRRGVTPGLVERAHGLGLFILVYTVNDESEFLRLLKMGVDGFFTNYPGEMLRWREKTIG